MALLDVVNYLESTSDSASLYGMNSLKGATSLIKEMLKKPDELFYYKNYAQIPVPEEYEKKFLLKMVDNVIEKRKLQMESAYPCCKCGHEAVLEDWKDRCRVRCSYCSTTGIDVSKSVYPDNADAVAVYMWNRNKNCVGSKTAKEMKKRVKSPV